MYWLYKSCVFISMNRIIQLNYKNKLWWFTIQELFPVKLLTPSTWGRNKIMLRITTSTCANEAAANSKGKVRMRGRSKTQSVWPMRKDGANLQAHRNAVAKQMEIMCFPCLWCMKWEGTSLNCGKANSDATLGNVFTAFLGRCCNLSIVCKPLRKHETSICQKWWISACSCLGTGRCTTWTLMPLQAWRFRTEAFI